MSVVFSLEGQYLSYMWCWIVSESKSHSEANSSGVAVIDGCQVLYTPFRYSIIPPPMSACKLLLPAPINELAFAPPPQSNDFLALLSNFKLAVFSFFGKETEDSTKVKGVVIHRAPELVGMARYPVEYWVGMYEGLVCLFVCLCVCVGGGGGGGGGESDWCGEGREGRMKSSPMEC